MNITEEEMQTSVWSMLCSWRVCKETCFKRGRVFQPKSAVCSVLTQLDKLKSKDSTAVFCFFSEMFVPGCPSSLTTSWCRLHSVSTEMSGFVVFLSAEAFGPRSFRHRTAATQLAKAQQGDSSLLTRHIIWFGQTFFIYHHFTVSESFIGVEHSCELNQCRCFHINLAHPFFLIWTFFCAGFALYCEKYSLKILIV